MYLCPGFALVISNDRNSNFSVQVVRCVSPVLKCIPFILLWYHIIDHASAMVPKLGFLLIMFRYNLSKY
uniref:Uncharacterized protein n=1 Tax=Wuchereria bancrofti TaxID=6293 RepID=A0A1I8EVK1_WUCBA